MPLSVSTRRERRGPLALAFLALFGLVIPAGVFAAKPPPPPAVDLQILNVSDWHANLDPVSTTGGAWNISARWQADRAAHDGPTLTLTAGDDFGASPPLASFFNEEPSIHAQRLMGIQVNTFGNHNFDKGVAHLQEMVNLAAAPSTGSGGEHPGEPFRYVATNLSNLEANLTGVDRVAYFRWGKLKVAVLGIVNEEAPSLVTPGNFGTITITDGVAATIKYATIARKAGANAVIVITHKGFQTLTPTQTGPLVDFASALPAGLVDVVIGDHTNVQGSGTAPNGVLYHENLSFGNSYAKTLLNVQPGRGGTVNSKSVTFVSPGPAGALTANNTSCGSLAFCDQDIVDMLVPFRTALAEALDAVIATTTEPFDRGNNVERRKEIPLGDLIADGIADIYDVQIGFMTGGGIRTQLPACAYQPVDHTLDRANWNSNHTAVVACPGYGNQAPYDVVIGDVYSVLPFGNNIVTRTVTGTQLWQALENGVSKCPNPLTDVDPVTCQGRFPQVSGIKFTFDVGNPTGCSGTEAGPSPTWSCTVSRVCTVTLADGTPIPQDSQTYTMAITDFTNAGGDSYFMLADGQGATRDRDANAFLAYVQQLGGVLDPTIYPLDRITQASC
ncbi:MAG TPA: 5'-nucleotidase C-terminal domain-containing protein [Candidatus Binatia bacterium]|nr:5'-nucleotidase C-terminal domain-containing protein [Candidatus Binatia bacterium]